MGVIVELRNPMESLEDKIKAHRFRVWKRSLLVVITLLAAVISTYLLVEMQTYTNMRVIQSYENGSTGTDNSSYIQYSDGVLKYSRDGIAFLDKRGEEQWNQSYQIKNPFVNIYEDAVAVADRGGNDILVFDKEGLKGEIHTTAPIEKVAVAKNGIVSVLLKNASVPQIICYDAMGNILVEHRASLSGIGYPVGMAISPDGTMLQVSYLSVVDGVEATRVAYYDFGQTDDKDEEREHQVTEDVYKNTVIPMSFFVNEKTSILIGDTAFYIYEGEKEPELSKTVELKKEIKSVFYDEEYIGFILKNSGEEESELRLYSLAGEGKLSKSFEGEYNNVKVSRGSVIMYDGKKCAIFSDWGIQKFEGEMETSAMEILPLSGVNKYLLINAGGMEEIRLVK